MNTPRKKRRYNKNEVAKLLETRAGNPGFGIIGLHHAECASLFATVVSTFVFLEEEMARVLARLTGCDAAAARHISAVIQSPATRVEIMRAVLERSLLNARTSETYDEILTEFKEISKLRNHYVHGKWETAIGRDEVYLLRPNDDPFALGSVLAKPFDLAEMRKTGERITALRLRILKLLGSNNGPVRP